MRLLKLFALSVSFCAQPALSAPTHGAWLGFLARPSFEDARWSFWQEVQFRLNTDQQEMAQLLTRIGLLRNLNDQNQVGLIVGYIETGLLKEYRPTLQHVFATQVADSYLSFRSRLELRHLESGEPASVRYRLMISQRFAISTRWSVLVWGEPFFNLTREQWTGNQSIDRARFFIGLHKTLQTYQFDVGYLQQFVPRTQLDVSEHLFTTYFYF